jgi:uncharacterized membrane protein
MASLEGLPLGVRIVILAMLPILEQKAAIPIGVLAGMNVVEVYVLTLLGALLPAPFIILFITSIFNWLRGFSKIAPIVEKLEQKALGKSEQIKTYEMLGLILFVGIPLPGTGVWTGALIAALLRLDKKKAIVSVALGAAICGLLVLMFTHGVTSLIF